MVIVVKKQSRVYEKVANAVRMMYPNAVVLDVTREGLMRKLDPSFPLRRVKVPGCDETSLSVLGVWEGLKVFSSKNHKEVDCTYFSDERKLGKIRGCKSYGKLVGIKVGEEIIPVEKAVETVFTQTYRETIENNFPAVLESLSKETRPVVLLDYKDTDRLAPVSHAELLKEMIESRVCAAAA